MMIRIIGIILILIGLFAVWTSFQAGTLRHDTASVIDDVRRVVTFFIKNGADKAMVNRWFEKLESFIAGVSVTGTWKFEMRMTTEVIT